MALDQMELTRLWGIAVRDDAFNHLVPSDVRTLIKTVERQRLLLRELLADYSHPNFTDRYGAADRIREELKR